MAHLLRCQALPAYRNRLRLRVVGGAAAVPPRPHTELPPPPPTLMPDRREPLACLAIAHCPPCEPQCWPLPRTPDSYTEGLHPQLLNPQLTTLGCSLLTPTILAESENWLWWEDLSPNCHTQAQVHFEVKMFALGLSQPNASHRRGTRRGDQEEGNLFSPKARWQHRGPQSCLQHSVPFFRPLSLLPPCPPLKKVLSGRGG